jgi:STE24 endopeptidase
MLIAILSFALVASAVLETWLSLRQIRHVSSHKDAVPDAFVGEVDLQDHRRAADYTVVKTRLKIVDSVWRLATTLMWLYFGIGVLQSVVAGAFVSPVLSGSILLVAIAAISSVLDLPLSAVGTFGVEARFGFNRTTPKLFVVDWLKNEAMSLVLAFILSCGLLWVMGNVSGLWWVWGWLGFLVFVSAMMIAYPLWIAPLFNRFSPLPDGELKARVEALLAKAGFASKGFFVMDGSKRSNHGNAYFTGFGKAKRIVFFDTLLETLTIAQTEAVLAHELGHFKHRDILVSLAKMAILSLAAFGWLGIMAKEPWLTASMGLPQTDAVGLVVAMLCLSPVGLLLAPLANWMSTRAESRADAYAATLLGNADDLSSALIRLSRDNASTLTPDPVYVLFHYSHPPVPIRVERLRTAIARS